MVSRRAQKRRNLQKNTGKQVTPLTAPSTVRTLADFVWSTPTKTAIRWGETQDLWCVRDAFSELFEWEPGSLEWSRFVEAPRPDDMDRLVDYFELKWYDPECFVTQGELIAEALDHPGVSVYHLHSLRSGHCIFQPHIRFMRELSSQYVPFEPELFRVIFDPSQPPRTQN